MNKQDLTEADIRTKFITPAIVGPDVSKWDVITQVREEHQFKGRVVKELERQLAAWQRAQHTRAYMEALTASRLSAVEDPQSRLSRWLRWMDAYAERLDPCVSPDQLPRDPTG